MPEVIKLKGIAWDHPRGYEPLKAASSAFSKIYPQVKINWDIRSLKEFGDMPIENLIKKYDLITIDHPYMGQAHANKLLLPLHNHIPSNTLDELARQSVGPSFQSYWYKEHLYALPIDAAALVAASRRDIISQLKLSLPHSRKDLLAFYKKIPKVYSVAWPLCATDLWCTFLTLCAQDRGRNFIQNYTLDKVVGSSVIDELKVHLNFLHTESINWNPIQVLDHMSSSNEIIYSPFLFGYTNYSRVGYSKNMITYHDSPSNPETDISTILGGVGLAISSYSLHPDLAIKFVSYVSEAKTQEGLYTQYGGQPGNMVAWENSENNTLCNNFFANTVTTMQNAYIRPKHVGWNQFQEQGAELIHQGIKMNRPSNIIMKELNQLYQSFKYEKYV